MIHNQRIEPAPPLSRTLHGFLCKREIRRIAGKYFDELGAELGLQLVEGRVRARDEKEFVLAGEEMVRGC